MVGEPASISPRPPTPGRGPAAVDPSPSAGPGTTARAAASGHAVFLSYCHLDFPAAEAACQALESAGATCWMAPRDITPGADGAAPSSRPSAAAACSWPSFRRMPTGRSRFLREINLAVDRRIPIILVRLDKAPLSSSMNWATGGSVTGWTPAGAAERVTGDLVRAAEKHLRGEMTGAAPAAPVLPGYAAAPGRGRRAWPALAAAALLAAGLLAIALARYEGRPRPPGPCHDRPVATLASTCRDLIAVTARRDERTLWNADRLPSDVRAARSALEDAWEKAPLEERAAADQQALYESLRLMVRLSRVEEKLHPTKPVSRQWADAAVAWFQKDGRNPPFHAGCLVEKAAVLMDVASLENADPEAETAVAREGRELIRQASAQGVRPPDPRSAAGDERFRLRPRPARPRTRTSRGTIPCSPKLSTPPGRPGACAGLGRRTAVDARVGAVAVQPASPGPAPVDEADPADPGAVQGAVGGSGTDAQTRFPASRLWCCWGR